ncbi:MAG: dipeptide epimerase [Gemmataceae bacterium]|nr:dipeptide epimerase [Gemmataceae bacterium]
MNVVELVAHRVEVPLKRAIKHASHARTSTANVVVRCVLDDGTVGHGEGVPRDYVTGETAESSLALLASAGLRAQLHPATTFEEAVGIASRITMPPVPGDARGINGNAARCAAELAYLDAAGRRFKRPLSDATALVAPTIHEPRAEVRYSGIITSSRGLKLRALAWVQRWYGFMHLKVKVGIAGQDDVKRLKLVRWWAGGAMDLRIDANEAWTPAEAVARLKELEPFGITSAEQPVAHESLSCLAQLRRECETPIMLDESLCGMIDAERAIGEGLCDLFNLRLSKCGGFIPSLRLAARAKEAGLACQLGCQVGETAILSAAGRHFAASVGGLRYVEGSYDGWLVREALGTRPITFGRGGAAPALPGGGLGVDIDAAALARITTAKSVL